MEFMANDFVSIGAALRQLENGKHRKSFIDIMIEGKPLSFWQDPNRSSVLFPIQLLLENKGFEKSIFRGSALIKDDSYVNSENFVTIFDLSTSRITHSLMARLESNLKTKTCGFLILIFTENYSIQTTTIMINFMKSFRQFNETEIHEMFDDLKIQFDDYKIP